MLGTFALASGYYDAYYGRAQRVRTLIVRDFARAFGGVDLVASPTSPTVAFRLGERTADPLAMYLADICTIPVSLAGLPALSIPCGLSEGLPVGLQLAGPAFSENRCSRAAHALEQAIGFDPPPPGPDVSAATAWEAVIGLEIHVQLATRTKMFCGCTLTFGDPPNTPHLPGLPGPPRGPAGHQPRGGRLAILVGLALGCEIAPRSEFHRKNYFYPDLPKAYQISQYDEPLCVGGRFTVLGEDGEREVRHHPRAPGGGRGQAAAPGRGRAPRRGRGSAVDFNRGGTPLVEIVTEPDLRSAAEAGAFLRQLRQTLRHLGVSDCNMEEGSLRADANVSVRPAGSDRSSARRPSSRT